MDVDAASNQTAAGAAAQGWTGARVLFPFLFAALTIWPLMVLAPPTFAAHIVQRMITLQALTVAAGAIAVAVAVARRRFAPLSPLHLAACVFAFAVGLAVVTSRMPRVSLESLLPLEVAGVLLLAWWAVGWRLDVVAPALVAGGALVAVLALRSFLTQEWEWVRWARASVGLRAAGLLPAALPRAQGPSGNPNIVAASLVAALPWCWWIAVRWGSRWVRVVAAVAAALSTGALLATDSRGGWLGAVAAAAVLVVGGRGRLRLRGRRAAVAALAALVVVGGVVMLVAAYPSVVGRATAEPRIEMARFARNAVLDHPLLGSGPGTFTLAYASEAGTPALSAVHAHNQYLQLLYDTGLVGALAAIVVLAVVLRGLWRARPRGGVPVTPAAWGAVCAAAACAGVAVHGLVDSPLLFLPVLVPVLAGLLAVAAEDRNAFALPRLRWGAGAARWLAVLGVPLLVWWAWQDVGGWRYTRARAAATRHDVPAAVRWSVRDTNWDGYAIYWAQRGDAAALAANGTAGWAAAAADFQRALDMTPLDPPTLAAAALAHARAGQRAATLAAIARFDALRVADPTLRLVVAEAYQRVRPDVSAVERYGALLADAPDLAGSDFFAADAWRRGHREAIVQAARDALRDASPHDRALKGALIEAGFGSAGAAARRLQDYLRGAPADAEARLALGLLELQLGRTDEAVREVEAGAPHAGDEAQRDYALGRVALLRGGVAAGRRLLLRAAYRGQTDALVALGDSFLPSSVPRFLEQQLRDRITADLPGRLLLVAQTYRFGYWRPEPVPILPPGDWPLGGPPALDRWKAALARWQRVSG